MQHLRDRSRQLQVISTRCHVWWEMFSLALDSYPEKQGIRRSQRNSLGNQPVLPEISNHTVSRRQPFVLMMQATDRQINPLRTSDIIEPAIDPFKNTDASCNRTHYGSNWVVCVGKSISTFYNWLLTMTNTRITPWVTVQGKGSARTSCMICILLI